ncbi:MAG: GIY-YIG nuclease family protein [Opitutales bacterium]|nr:GIY-YIG nuclease family protein [Opitutales bacterium]
MYFTYILKSSSNNRYYIGYSSDLDERLQKHNAGYSKATKSGVPWNIVWSHSFDSKSDAIKLEKWLKKMKSAEFLDKVIRGEIDISKALR